MTPNRRNKLMFRWSLFSAGLIALFWLIWSMFGEVPSVDKIKWMDNVSQPDTYIHLPFSISRWFDILFGPIYSALIVNFVYWAKNRDKSRYDNLVTDFVIGLVVGLGFGLASGLVVGLGFVLGFGLAVGGLVVGLGFGLASGLVVGLVYLIK